MKTTLLASLVVAGLALGACGEDSRETARSAAPSSSTTVLESATTGTTAAPTPSTRKPPDAENPAAGICPDASEDPGIKVVEVIDMSDVPSPRCTKVRSDQKLRITNKNASPIEVAFADHSFQLAPDESRIIEEPFGTYLLPGVHTLRLGETHTADIWLEE